MPTFLLWPADGFLSDGHNRAEFPSAELNLVNNFDIIKILNIRFYLTLGVRMI